MKNIRITGIVWIALLMALFCFASANAASQQKVLNFDRTFHLAASIGCDFRPIHPREDLYKRWIRRGEPSTVFGPCGAKVMPDGDAIMELFEIGEFPENDINQRCGYSFRMRDEYTNELGCEPVIFEWPAPNYYKDTIVFCVAQY